MNKTVEHKSHLSTYVGMYEDFYRIKSVLKHSIPILKIKEFTTLCESLRRGSVAVFVALAYKNLRRIDYR